MKFYLIPAAAMLVPWALATPPQAPPPAGAKAPDAARVRELVKQLDAQQFAVREQADKALREMGIDVVPLLRKALAEPAPLESRRRLERIIAHLTAPPWHRDVTTAVAAARKAKKPILVFSTMGEPSGFS